jgi:dipeptidyl aminopeptidase/acylaminoacyl peptidase
VVRRLRRLLLATGIGSILATVAYGAASAMIYDKLSRVPGGCPARFGTNSPTAFSVPAPGFDPTPYWMPAPEEVRFPSRDPDITVSGWWLPASDPDAPAVVVVHGLRACKRDYTVLIPAGMLHRNGFSVLLIDLRDHGESTRQDGRQAGGADEAWDALGAWDWVRSDRGIESRRIGLVGLSFGAAVAIMAAGRERAVTAVWADSSYTDVVSLVRDQLRQDRLPLFLDAGARFAARVLSGHDLDAYSPLAAIEDLDGQALFVTHGEADAVIPVRHSEVLDRAAVARGLDAPLWIVPGATHTAAEYSNAPEYEQRLVGFFRAELGSAP